MPVDRCIQACRSCAETCSGTLPTLVGGRRDPARSAACSSCAEICTFCANELTRGSVFARQACALCAAICRHCAGLCAPVAVLGGVVAACEDCERQCRGYAG